MQRYGSKLIICCLALVVIFLITPKESFAQTFSCNVASEIPQPECEALVTIYNSTGGSNWLNHTNWLQTNTPCNWRGVACTNGHVAGLQIASNSQTGHIPTEIGNLSYLTNLDMRDGQLTGTIPSEIGNLVNLGALYLMGNNLNGSIPSTFGNLNHLIVLELSNNQLTGSIPSEFGNMTNVSQIFLYNNRLAGNIPSSLGQLTNLKDLILYNNQLTGNIPSELGNLTNLLSLRLNSNQLAGGIPPQLGNLSKMTELDLSNNQLSNNIVPELSNATNLHILNLEHNEFTGTLPNEYINSNIVNLDISFNELSGTVPVLLPNGINSINISHNQLSGPIPSELANISSLHALYLSNNQLTGNIPQELANLNLGILDVSFNQLTGTIPPLWTAPISLLFSHNHLTGNIPPELANAGSGTLDLSYNELTGSIPPELGNLTNLSELNLSHNHLTGTIPAALGNNSEFILTFNLGANQLSGTIPAELGNFPYLCTLDLSSNLLQGEVPENITNLNHLNTLDEDCVAETNSHLGLSFNMLKADNQTTATFLTQKAPDWSQTQTVPPTNLSVSVSPVGNTSALLNWTPIPYTGDNGYYIVYSATTPGGPYTQVGTTANKSASSFQTSTLLLGHSYYFVIRTYTPLHGEQQNSLLSPISSEVSLTTPSPTQLIQQLISTVESFNLQQGIQNSFDAKLQNAQDSLSAENAGVRQDAINKLQAFIQAVEAQSGNKITTSQADLLVNSAQSIINGL